MPRRVRTSTYLTLGLVITGFILLIHASYFTLPPVWDEVYWSWRNWPPVPVVRTLALLMTALTALGAFLLGVELCGSLPGVPALVAVAALVVSPLFYMQSVLVLPAMPVTLCATFGLWFAARRRWLRAAACAIALMAVVAFTAPLFHFWISVPGTRSFVLALARRLFVLFVADGHFVASAGLAMALVSGRLQHRGWKIAGAFCAAWFILCLFCRPRSDRELLPILPVLFIAAVAGFHTLIQPWRNLACALLVLSLTASLFLHPLNLPFPMEDSLALGDAAELHRQAAAYLASRAPTQTICATSPMFEELSRPELRYVVRPLNVLRDCSARTSPEFYVRFSEYWEAPGTLTAHSRVRSMLHTLLDVNSPLSPAEVESTFGMRRLTRMERDGQSVEIYGRYFNTRKTLE